jgi:hypothetical protein
MGVRRVPLVREVCMHLYMHMQPGYKYLTLEEGKTETRVPKRGASWRTCERRSLWRDVNFHFTPKDGNR